MARCVFQIICILIIQLWLSPLTTSNAENKSEPDCIPSIMVPRNTMWKIQEMKSLKINCTVESESHCWKNIDVLWCRIDDKNECGPLNNWIHLTTEWKNITEIKKMFFLVFHNVSMQDSGLYRCKIKSPTPTVSHTINVTVTEYVSDHTTHDYEGVIRGNSTTNSSNPDVRSTDWLPSYVYICSGVGGLLVVVVVVSIIVIRCRRQRRPIKKKIHEKQPTPTPVPDLAPPVYKPRESPRFKTQTLPAQLSPPPPAIYDTPPVRVMSLRDRPSAGRHPVNQGAPRRCQERGPVEEVEEEDPLIYATLNHEAAPQRPVRVAHVQIEASEYAAIKVT